MHARLVVADDDPAVRGLIGAALAGYTVFEAARGDDALALIHRERPDLILLDVQMPGLDGLAVVKALAADAATAAIPVVLCSGAGSEAAAAARRLSSVRAFLPKPFSLQALRATVQAALAQPHPPGPDDAPQALGTTLQPTPEVVHVLVVHEQPVICAVLTLALAHVFRDYDVRVVPDVALAVDALDTWRPRLVIIDMSLEPGVLLNRLGVAATVDGQPGAPGARVPVVGVVRRGDLPTMLAALDGGVDDLLSLPCSPAELVARLLKVLQRTSSSDATLRPLLRLGELELDLLSHDVRLGAATVSLTALEQHLLYLLVANAGRALTRDEILDHVWGVDFIAEPNSVDQHVRALRGKLQQGRRASRLIAAVPGRGYTFLPPTTSGAAPRHPATVLPAGRRRVITRRPGPRHSPPTPSLAPVPSVRQHPETPDSFRAG